jgi:hypothetical protein
MRHGAALPLAILILGGFLASLIVLYGSLIEGLLTSIMAAIIAVLIDMPSQRDEKVGKKPASTKPRRHGKMKAGWTGLDSGVSVCAICHHNNPSGNNFCGNCGRPLRDETKVY